MACALTTGRKVPCKSGFGGIKTVYMADYGTLGTATVDADGSVYALSGTPTWFQFDVKGNSSLETTITSSRDNGTTFYTQTLNLTLTYLEVETQEEIKLGLNIITLESIFMFFSAYFKLVPTLGYYLIFPPVFMVMCFYVGLRMDVN